MSKIGVVFRKMCGHCHNEDYWILTKTTRWFTLFFIPVIPLETHYFLACPICRYGFTLKGDQVHAIKPLAEINQRLVDGRITRDQHAALIDQLNAGQSAQKDKPAKASPEIVAEGKKAELVYCGNCGNGLSREDKFCGGCGTSKEAA